MPRHEYGSREAVAAAASSLRAPMGPAHVLASTLSFHQSRGEPAAGLAHRTRRASANKKRDSFATVSDEGSAAESSWHSLDGSAGGADGLLHVPELLLTGSQLEKRVGLQILHKKGDGFEAPWEPCFVGVYAHALFFYETLASLPRGVVPLTGAVVAPVDRIYRSGDRIETAVMEGGGTSSRRHRGEECGPCWKVTSTAGRVLLFRAPTPDSRGEWVAYINQWATGAVAPLPPNGPRRRASRATTPPAESPLSSQLWFASDEAYTVGLPRQPNVAVDSEVSDMLRDAMLLVNKQKQEILELKAQVSRQQVDLLHRQKSASVDEVKSTSVQQGSPIVVSSVPPPPPLSTSSSTSLSSPAVPLERLSLQDRPEDADQSTISLADVDQRKPVAAEDATVATPRVDTATNKSLQEQMSTAVPGIDAATSKSLQQQTAALAEMARYLNRDDNEPTRVLNRTRSGGKEDRAAAMASSPHALVESSNEFLQQQAIELAEIAKTLQSSFRLDRQKASSMGDSSSSVPSSTSTILAADSTGQINSNDSNESILSFNTDDSYYLDDDGEIERLSEFEASDNHFLEASGLLDSIQQVMKDFIVSTDVRREPSQPVINDDVFAEIRQNMHPSDSQNHSTDHHANDSDENSFFNSRRLRGLRSKSSGDYSTDSSRIFGAFSRVQSARDFLNDSNDEPAPVSPKDLAPVLVEESMIVVESVLQTAGRDEKMLLLHPLLRVFGSHNRLGHLISWAIDIEVSSVLNVATLFRSDDYASRLVSTYSKAVGTDFIRIALAEPIQEILALDVSDIELSPDKDEAVRNEGQASSNAENLMNVCQRVIDSIVSHVDDIPASYFHICSHLNSKVINRFDGTKEGIEAEDATTLTRAVIGGFLFLRFVCPAITTPHLYGLIDEPAPSATRRILVLVTKLIFKTATSVQFNDREAQYKVLNPFIEKNSAAMQRLFETLAVVPDGDIDACFSADSRGIFSDVPAEQQDSDLAMIRTVATKNMDKIEGHLVSRGCAPPTASHFKAVVLSSDPSSHKHAKTKKLMMNMRFLGGFGKRPKKQQQQQHAEV